METREREAPAPEKVGHVTAAVLAGGKGKRMGRDKAAMELAGKPLILHAAEGAAAVFERVIVSGPENLKEYWDPVIPDERAGVGPLAGILSCLKAAADPWVFFFPCDSPFVPEEFMRGMSEQARDCDVVVPRPGDFYEPIHALYNRRCIPEIERLIEAGERQIIKLYAKVRVKEISVGVYGKWDPEGLAFFNINTPDDWSRAEGIIGSGRK